MHSSVIFLDLVFPWPSRQQAAPSCMNGPTRARDGDVATSLLLRHKASTWPGGDYDRPVYMYMRTGEFEGCGKDCIPLAAVGVGCNCKEMIGIDFTLDTVAIVYL